ncbi:MAG: hypothetical protein WDZ35_10290 [Crocinitomicaceae bacterium]
MKKKTLLMLPFMALLFACGGGEESTKADTTDATTDNTEETENTETTEEYNTTFESCIATESTISKGTEEIDESYDFFLEPLEGEDLSTFKTATAELNKKHTRVTIEFVNNPEVAGKGLANYGPEDRFLSIIIKSEDGELKAGAYTEDDLDIKFRKGKHVENNMKTQGIGSNKTPKSVVINSISEDNICGSFKMTTEEGVEIASATFNLDVTLSDY